MDTTTRTPGTYETDYPMAAKVYFTRDISPAGLMRAYEALGAKPQGKVAVDQACVDMVYVSHDNKDPLIERIESRHGIHTIEHAVEMGLGSREYQLIDLDAR